jgi:hypothetical protein
LEPPELFKSISQSLVPLPSSCKISQPKSLAVESSISPHAPIENSFIAVLTMMLETQTVLSSSSPTNLPGFIQVDGHVSFNQINLQHSTLAMAN